VILDSSAILAILLDEPERSELARMIRRADLVGVGAPTLVETGMVLSSRVGEGAMATLEAWLARTDIATIAFDASHWGVALRAWATYGKGRHPARLNLGDCLAYATAKVARLPLLATGDDFARTDIELVRLGP
jgi:ribonuclease VapC